MDQIFSLALHKNFWVPELQLLDTFLSQQGGTFMQYKANKEAEIGPNYVSEELQGAGLPWMSLVDVHLIEILLGFRIVQPYCANAAA